jgi:hypothetical protein
MITNSRRKDETLERLTNGIAQLTNSERWTTWLRVQARFHRYSFSNALLVALQCPGATRVTGFQRGAGWAEQCGAGRARYGFLLLLRGVSSQSQTTTQNKTPAS